MSLKTISYSKDNPRLQPSPSMACQVALQSGIPIRALIAFCVLQFDAFEFFQTLTEDTIEVHKKVN